MTCFMKTIFVKNPLGQPQGGEVGASTTTASMKTVRSMMSEAPHDVPNRGGTNPRKM